MVCTHAVMSYLIISVISQKTAHRFCYCFVLSLSIKRWPPPLAALKKTYIQLTSWLKLDNINSSCAPCLWLLILWWNFWDLSNLTLWFWTGYGGELASPFPCLSSHSPPPSPDMSDVLQPGSCRILEEGKKPEKVPKIWFHMVWLKIESTFLSILTCFIQFYFTKKWFVERNPGTYQFWVIKSNK